MGNVANKLCSCNNRDENGEYEMVGRLYNYRKDKIQTKLQTA